MVGENFGVADSIKSREFYQFRQRLLSPTRSC